MDPTRLALCLGDRRHHLPDALPHVLTALAFLAVVQPVSLYGQEVEGLRNIPAPSPIAIQPRVFSAYGALIAAAMLSLLYLYRGRAFVVYWIGDEFLLLLTCSEREAVAKAEELKSAFQREKAEAGLPAYVRLSIGVAAVSKTPRRCAMRSGRPTRVCIGTRPWSGHPHRFPRWFPRRLFAFRRSRAEAD